jgi:hypothetical protein
MKWLSRLFNEHKFVRRFGVVWAWVIITWVAYQVFADVSKINSAVNAALGIITALLTTVLGHYQWSRTREDMNARMDNE